MSYPTKRPFQPCDEFFREGNEQREISAKIWSFDASPLPRANSENFDFVCRINGCDAFFSNVSDFDSHYKSKHTFVCATEYCGAVFPTSRYLELHVLENHDSYFRLLKKRQNSFECLLENCSQKFRTRGDRTQHLISVHQFPPRFRFDKRRNVKEKKPKHNTQTESVEKSNITMEEGKIGSSILSATIPTSISSPMSSTSPISGILGNTQIGISQNPSLLSSVLSSSRRSSYLKQPQQMTELKNSAELKMKTADDMSDDNHPRQFLKKSLLVTVEQPSGSVASIPFVPRQLQKHGKRKTLKQKHNNTNPRGIDQMNTKSETLDDIDDLVADTQSMTIGHVPRNISFGRH